MTTTIQAATPLQDQGRAFADSVRDVLGTPADVYLEDSECGGMLMRVITTDTKLRFILMFDELGCVREMIVRHGKKITGTLRAMVYEAKETFGAECSHVVSDHEWLVQFRVGEEANWSNATLDQVEAALRRLVPVCGIGSFGYRPDGCEHPFAASENFSWSNTLHAYILI